MQRFSSGSVLFILPEKNNKLKVHILTWNTSVHSTLVRWHIMQRLDMNFGNNDI